MPIQYAVPPQLNFAPASEVPQRWLQGAQIGANIKISRERNAAALAEASMRAAVQREQIAAQAARQQQELLIQQKQNEMLNRLRDRELQQAQQKVDLDMQQWAARSAALQQLDADIKGGMSHAQAYLKNAAGLGIPLSGIAGLLEATTPVPPPKVVQFPGSPERFLESGKATDRSYQRLPAEGATPGSPGFGQTYPLYGDKGEVLAGARLFPTTTGYTSRNLPAQALATARANMARMEANKIFGPYLQTGKEPTNEKMREEYRRFKSDYDKSAKIVMDELDRFINSGTEDQEEPETPTTGADVPVPTEPPQPVRQIPKEFISSKGVMVQRRNEDGTYSKGYLTEEEAREALGLPYSQFKLGWK